MITLAIAGILAALAVPSFADLIKNNRMTTQYNEFLASLSIARSEAIKRAITVTVCKSNDQSTPACAGDWHDGWVVFVDNDADGVFDVGVDEVIRVHSVLSGGNTLNFARDRISYRSDALATGFTGTFTLCDDRGDSSSKGLVVSNTGRVRQAIASDALASCPV
jgi:type IV fimbrial biogenesis protein FimT